MAYDLSEINFKTVSDPRGLIEEGDAIYHANVETAAEKIAQAREEGGEFFSKLELQERAKLIINNCANPEYRPLLQDYYDRALKATMEKGVAHTPHILKEAFDFHVRLAETGSMKKK